MLGASIFCGVELPAATSARAGEREMEDDIRASLYSNRSSGLVYFAHSTVIILSCLLSHDDLICCCGYRRVNILQILQMLPQGLWSNISNRFDSILLLLRKSVLRGVAGFIIITEFCERLAYYGFAGSLVLFFQTQMNYSNATADIQV